MKLQSSERNTNDFVEKHLVRTLSRGNGFIEGQGLQLFGLEIF
jgi:hypothetical protein